MDFEALGAIADPDELLRLAELLESGLLPFPPGALALRDHVASEQITPLARNLEESAGQSLEANHIALALRAYVAGRKASNRAAPPVEVVVSGPDVKGNSRDTGVVMRQLFGMAKKRVLAVGFAVHQGKSVFRKLAERLDSDQALEAVICVDIRRPHGDTSLERDIVRRFANQFVGEEWPGERLPKVCYDPRSLRPTGSTSSSMHAKCVVADGQHALVTSANFTEAAQERNVELGLLIDSKTIAGQIEGHFNSLIRREFLAPLPLPAT